MFSARTRKRHGAFTIAELLAALPVLLLLVVLISQLCNSTQAVITMGHKHMDADAQARAVFDRMATDFAQMVHRPDVDCFLKDASNAQPGNDQIAFYSQVPGYYSPSGGKSPVSLVAYRVFTNGTTAQLQRLGYGLEWNGISTGAMTAVSGTDTPAMPVVFSSGIGNAISSYWPIATSSAQNPNYELAGPQVFRMEYYYILKGQNVAGASFPSCLSAIPWDVRVPGHTSVSGLQDVAAIGVVIAFADARSQLLITPAQLADLQSAMLDFPTADTTPANPGDLEAQWQRAINISGLPRAAAAGIRIYRRWFYLSSTPTLVP